MGNGDSGSNTLTVTGGNNMFAVVYNSAGGPAASGTIPFGAVGALNNTNPAFDFTALDNGKVYVVPPGGSDMTIEGGNKQFVVEYLASPGADDTASNTVDVGGGNNAFVVADAAPASGSGYRVSVDGGNNAFVVAVGASEGGNSVSVGGGNNQYVVANGTGAADGMSFSGPGLPGSGNSAGVTLGTAGNNSVAINGDNNQYVTVYGNPGGSSVPVQGDTVPSVGDGMSGSISGGNPFAASAGGASSSGAPSTADLTSLLQASPFGRILDIPGVSVNTLLAGFASATAGNNAGAAGGGNPFGSVMAGSNPFANYPGTTSIFSGASSASGAPSGSPFGAPTGAPIASPVAAPAPADIPAATGYTYDFGGNGPAPVASIPATGALSGDDLTTLLKASPFGAIFSIPGVDPNTVLAGFSSPGGNPFGGNPFAAIGPNGTSTGAILSSSDITALVMSSLPQS